MSKLPIEIDQLSFFLGGYSAFGVALYSGNLFKMIPDFGGGVSGIVPISAGVTPPDNNNVNVPVCPGPEPESGVKKYVLILTRAGLIVLRTAERLLVGGCVYTFFNESLKESNNFPTIVNAFISGGIVGVIQVGVNKGWKKLLTYGVGAAAFSGGMETLIMALQSVGLMGVRPTFKFIFGPFNPDPIVLFVGVSGSIFCGVASLFPPQCILFRPPPPFPFPLFPLFPQFPPPAAGDECQMMLRFLWSCPLNGLALGIRAIGHVFVSGWVAWGVHDLLKQMGIQHRVVTSMAVGGALAGYCSTYGKRVNRTRGIWMGGTTLLTILSDLCHTHSLTGAIMGSSLGVFIGCHISRYVF